MSDNSKKTASEIQDQDLDQAQGGFEINFATPGDMVSVQIDHNHQVVGDTAVNINNEYQTANDIAVNINNEY